MDLNYTTLITWGVSLILGSLSVFFSVKYGLSGLEKKVETMDRNIESDLKEIKITVSALEKNQTDTAKSVALLEYRQDQTEKKHAALESKLTSIEGRLT